MRVMCSVLMSFLAIGFSAWGSPAYGEPTLKSGISFALPYPCNRDEDGRIFCLADSIKAKLDVVLVSKEGNCSAKTADTFDDDESGGSGFKATHLTGTEDCSPEDTDKDFDIAVVVVDAPAVQVVEPKNDISPLSKGIELKARKIAGSRYKEILPGQPDADVADSPPDVFSVGKTPFLLFRCTYEFWNQDGLPLLVLKNNAFLLEGICASRSPFFFSVREKLYLAYWATLSCCGCGDMNFFVCDLSGELPKLVYCNANFSD